jgi:hypothetical protein
MATKKTETKKTEMPMKGDMPMKGKMPMPMMNEKNMPPKKGKLSMPKGY